MQRYCGVYFLEHVESEMTKIGSSYNIQRRIRDLRNTSPVRLKVVGYIPTTDEMSARNLEADLHQQFEDSRHHGEWFYQIDVTPLSLAILSDTQQLPLEKVEKPKKRGWFGLI